MTELANKARMFDRIRELFGVGASCEHHVTLTCATHCKDFADKLHAIERKYFMAEGAIEEEFPDSHPEQVCMVNSWGDSTDEYVKSFGEALNKIYKYDQLIAENAAQKKLITQQAEQLKMLRDSLLDIGTCATNGDLLALSDALLSANKVLEATKQGEQ